MVVQSRVEDLSPVVKKLSVELAPDRVKDALDRAYLGLSRTVKLKGYRAGHVPRRLVERYFGDDVKKDVAQKLVADSIHEALDEHRLTPVAPPRVENGDVKAGEPFKYVATVEVRPKIEPKDYLGLPTPKVDVEIADARVDEELEELRQRQAMFIPVEGREVAEAGDYAVADYEATIDGAPLKGGRREGALLEVAAGSLLDNRTEELRGARIGETREIDATFPPDHGAVELRGRRARFRVTVRGLKRREIPALDDQFAQDLGGEAKTLAELREKVRTELAIRERDRKESARRDAVLSALSERNPIEAPPVLVERNVDAMLQGMLEGFHRRGLDAQKLGLDLDRLRDDLRPRAVLEVKGYLLLEAIAEKEGISASDEDLERHYAKLAEEMHQPLEKMRAAFRRQDSVDSLRARLRQEKALAFLLEKASPQ